MLNVVSRARHIVRSRLVGRPTNRVVTVAAGPGAGLRISLRNASADYSDGTNELPVQEALVGALTPGAVCYDVGSNIGFFALLAARAVGPTGKVYAFEPVAENAECIAHNAALNGFSTVEVVQVAVGRSDGEADLLLARHPGGATLSPADAPADLRAHRRTTVTSLDALVTAGRIAAPAVVKVDVEGLEDEVLDGMTEVLAQHRPTVVCELDSVDPAVLAGKVARFRARMADAGYEVSDLAPSYAGSGWHVYHGLARPAAR